MSEPTATTFVFDYDAAYAEIQRGTTQHEMAYNAYQEIMRQLSLAGWVMVQKDDLTEWMNQEIDLAYDEGILAIGDEAASEWAQELRNHIATLASTEQDDE